MAVGLSVNGEPEPLEAWRTIDREDANANAGWERWVRERYRCLEERRRLSDMAAEELACACGIDHERLERGSIALSAAPRI
jgi:hypothetical protein